MGVSLQIVLYVIVRFVQLLLITVEVAMMMRAILSWFIMDEENKLMMFLVILTEPVIFPFRVLCSKFRILDEMPLDVPFGIAMLVVAALNMFLPAVAL